MIPRKVKLENFLSFGKPGAEIEFTDDEPLWVLCGPNGVGKSAVFDAMTYALFGCHRGGNNQGMGELIRHGTNGFHIEFEFAAGAREYRITRSRGAKPVERVFEKSGSEWVPINLERVPVKAWAERELGLTFEQFTASVLLRQGEADAIITASGKPRLEMLKKIIGVEPYERLSERVKRATTSAKSAKERASDKLRDVLAVTPEELEAANGEQEKAERALSDRQADEQLAAGRVTHARDYNRLKLEMDTLTAQLDAASARRARAKRIHEDHARLVELRAVVPTLTGLIPARDERARLEPQIAQLESDEGVHLKRFEAATSARDIARTDVTKHAGRADEAKAGLKELASARKAHETQLKVAEEVEGIDAQLFALPAALDELLRKANAERDGKQREADEARDALVTAQALLKQREKELKDFDKVEIGATCSRCRQLVTAEHAKNEREAFRGKINRLDLDQTAAETHKKAADNELAVATKERDGLAARQVERDNLINHRNGLVRHSAVESSASIRAQLKENEDTIARLTATEAEERGKAQAAETCARSAETTRAEAEKKLDAARTALGTARRDCDRAASVIDALVPTLTGRWAAAWEAISAVELGRLSADLNALATSAVEADFRALSEENALDTARTNRLNSARTEMKAIPEDARIPLSEAEHAAGVARERATIAVGELHKTQSAVQSLIERQKQRATLIEAEKYAETDARVHDKLNRLLGAEGLQRELVRSAERQIVRFADEIVRHLSDGDLSIELDDAEDGTDKALELRVRRADDPTPIDVKYLSGSQKFRVAVAVALAIGRFATSGTEARPLESVIIDEGFGSLDKDGLRCMADELHRLKDMKDTLGLKRVILVSHQEEFVRQFPVGWQLERGDTGTTATKIRR